MAEGKKSFKFRINKDYLLSLLHDKESKVLLSLKKDEYSIIPYLEDQKYTEEESKSQILEIIVEIVSRACSVRSERYTADLTKFLRMLKSCDNFLFEDVPRLLYAVVSQEENSINVIPFMSGYMTILKVLLRQDFFPSENILNKIFPTLENYMNRLRERGISDLSKVEDCFKYLQREVERLDEPADTAIDEEVFIENFRTLSIVPRLNDIVNYEIPNIPQNIIDRPYKSVDHYLNVHYRLMREDMLRSFRECVKTSLSPNSRLSTSNVYDKVEVLSLPKYQPEGITYKIKITASKEIDWGRKEVLTPGSLVFLTPDEFNSVVFATVKKNPRVNYSKSKETCITVKLEDDQYNDELCKGKIYKMIEPSAYFECYKHVLSAIKEFSENTFPFPDIITYFNFVDPTPKYMDNINKYCLHENCDVELTELDGSCSCKVFNPLGDNEWPSSNDLKLDDMQYIAFKTALTKKVAVIQGPPGTGKTTIGVKVVKSLLINIPHKPIVICCLTNHALDQFLERILNFTKKVVRLGSQSKSEVLCPNKIDNMVYAIRQYVNDGIVSDEALKKSINIVRKIAPELLTDKPIKPCHEPLYYEIESLCKEINNSLNILSQCQDKFLEDDALNAIINSKYKYQLRLVPGAIRKSLSAGVLDWLLCSRSSDLYEKCLKKFEQFKKRNDLNCSSDVQNIWSIAEINKRYEMFYFWRKKCLQICKKQYEDNLETYKNYVRNFKDRVADNDKLSLVRCSDIIGVTTTGACKFRELIRHANPRIIVIEEAAQVLESHVIASLLPTIQHLILIGDHEQLRPLPANHELSERYNLKISMFERLFNNGAPSATLEMQHRMKPCIAKLLVPRPYSQYTSAQEVYNYEEIRGVETSVFFFDHRQYEDKNSSGASSSNDFEAQMLVSFAKYLTFIQYPSNDITIIATYAAQVVLILHYLEVQKVRGIKVTTVDNFQGEESEIILISFVRSNENAIGFLKESNRVCVALSRARKGMFCFGNFKLYADKNDLWRNIYKTLQAENMTGDTLLLKCARHLTTHPVNSSEGILGFLSNGCSKDCDFELPCNHLCTRKCHFTDPDHLYYACKKPCEKMIDDNRVCPHMCYEKCKKSKKTYIELPCGHVRSRSDLKCYEEIPVRLSCNHMVTIPCHMDVSQYSCKAVVNITLDCGHINSIRCFEQNLKRDVICTGLRQVVGPCGHTIDIPCSIHLTNNQISSLCNKSCESLLDCRHPCVGWCRVCFDIGIHAFCSDKCDLKLSCGHKCEGYCGSPCPPCENKCFLKCGHNVCINDCLRPCIECEKPCERVCLHKKCTNLCWEDCNVDPCMEWCKEKLPCGHRCIGFCGDLCPDLCRECDKHLLKYGNDIDARYVMLECNDVIEVNEMKELLNDCLESFEWPSCPQCNKLITQLIRFKRELKLAKKTCLDSCDTSKIVSEVQYLVESMYGVDYIVPASFMPVHKEIQHLLKQRNPQSHTLMVLKSCIMLLRKLYSISSKFNEFDDSYFQERFDTLMLWIRYHLTNASFQQLSALRLAVEQLESDVSSNTRLRLGDHLL